MRKILGSFLWIIVVFAFALILSNESLAQQMDPASRDLLIQKLTQVQRGLAPNDSSKVSVTLRLADLLAERARLASMQELANGCTSCVAGKEDRALALRYYKEVFEKVPLAAQGKVMIQMGHLYELTGQELEAKKFYQKTADATTDVNAKAEAHLSLAEMLFKKNQFAEAKKYYQEVLRVPTAQSRGLAAYRAAWCSFHAQDFAIATREIEVILETPGLLSKSGLAQGQVDLQFQEEVSRDYATFLSKTDFKEENLQKLFDLSPESTRLSNVIHLANESEQGGRKQESLKVWSFAFDHQKNPANRIESQLHKAILLLELGQKEKSLNEFSGFKEAWKDLKGCGRESCDELRKMWHQSIVVWNQAEKKSPTQELSTAYAYYLEIFPNDVQMQAWGAQLAHELKQNEVAFDRQKQAVLSLSQVQSQAKSLQQQDKMQFESAMLTLIEYAESLQSEAKQGNPKLLEAQDYYLQNTKLATKSFEVRYQKARDLYEQNKMSEAANELRILAIDKKGDHKLRLQAANLALDAWALQKEEEKLLSWADEFSSQFPKEASQFQAVKQKTILSQSARLAGAGDNAGALASLIKFNVADASPEDRILFLKNKLILSEKVQDFKKARSAAEDLLLIKNLKPEDREFALERKAWLSELQLDFASAFQATNQMSFQGKPAEVKSLKLALYADLSGQNAVPLYQQYMKTTQDEEAKQAVASEIVRRSADPMREIQSHKNILEKSPDLLARLYSEAYNKTPTDKILKTATSDLRIQKTNWGKLLSRVAFLKEFKVEKEKIASMQLNAKNQKLLAQTIKDRGLALNRIEKFAARAIESADWTTQLVAIDVVAKESSRFYQELMSLPMPEGLKPEEETEYMQLLSQQAAPFKAKSDQAANKISEFWSSTNWRTDLEKSIQVGSEFKNLVAIELDALISAASGTEQAANQDFLKSLQARNSGDQSAQPQLQDIENARNLVREKPLDKVAVEKLFEIEKKANNFAMVQYLEGRIRILNEMSNSLPTPEKEGEKK